MAKVSAAEAALRSLIQFKNPAEAQVGQYIFLDNWGTALTLSHLQAAIGDHYLVDPSHDFTSDVLIGDENQEENITATTTTVQCMEEEEETKEETTTTSGPAKKTKPAKKFSAGQNPLMTLNEVRPGLSWECSESGHSPATKKFCMKVQIEGETFEGSGVSKKLAKQAAAKTVLAQLYNLQFTLCGELEESNDPGAEMKVAGTDMVLSEFSENQSVADNIGRLILEKYDQLMVGHSQVSRRKVIAGIVMTLDLEMKKMIVVCVSTGTKCISGEYMSESGSGLNDCHAEIISRRCLMDFLYSQLERIVSTGGQLEEESVLTRAEGGGYRVRDEVRFHLYINTAPCGDARIFSPHEENRRGVYEGFDGHHRRQNRGQLRTKIESGEGTIPVKNSEGVQTWDGVMQGSRLLTMSCADKVCRWNVLGLQGSLLSYFLEPVYLHSVVLGSLFHPTHMYRALTGRVKATLGPLPTGYRLNTPKFNLMTSKEVRNPGKGPNYSVNWTIGNQEVEVVDAMKGKLQDSQKPSRLCKFSMFRRWLELVHSDHLQRREAVADTVQLYSQAKMGSKTFQEAKLTLFKVAGFIFYKIFILFLFPRHLLTDSWVIGLKNPWNRMSSSYRFPFIHSSIHAFKMSIYYIILLFVIYCYGLNSTNIFYAFNSS